MTPTRTITISNDSTHSSAASHAMRITLPAAPWERADPPRVDPPKPAPVQRNNRERDLAVRFRERVMPLLANGPMTADEISIALNLPVGSVSGYLISLARRGVVTKARIKTGCGGGWANLYGVEG